MSEEKIVKVQRMFPNCRKYDKCCRIDKPFWDELESKTKEIEYKTQPFRTKNIKLEFKKPPEGFEGW